MGKIKSDFFLSEIVEKFLEAQKIGFEKLERILKLKIKKQNWFEKYKKLKWKTLFKDCWNLNLNIFKWGINSKWELKKTNW